MNSSKIINNIAFYSPDLHKSLESGIINNGGEGGIYLLMFRLLKKDSNVLIYNYIYYPEIFVNSMLAHLIIRSEYGTSFAYRDWGDFHCLIDKNLGDDSDEVIKILKLKHIELNERLASYQNSDDFIMRKNSHYMDMQYLIDNLKVHTFIQDIDEMLKYLDYYISKEYVKVFTDIYKNVEPKNGVIWEDYFNKYISPEVRQKIYLLRDTLVVVKDKDDFINRLEKKGYKFHKGYKDMRYQLNTMSGFLYGIDSDYRYSLYKHQLAKVEEKVLPSQLKLTKSKYSFTNIHYNIGKNMRYFSTNNCLKSSILPFKNNTLNNRERLFEENYKLVDVILNKHFYVGSTELQKSIEKVLLNQENLFSSNRTTEYKWNFNGDTYEFLTNIRSKLNKLLLHPSDNNTIDTSYYSSKYIPLYKSIILELGVELVSDLLLSYFLEVLSKETVKLKDVDKETPGIATLTAFQVFGSKIMDRFVFSKYSKSEIKLKGGSLSEYKIEYSKEFSPVYEDSNYTTVIGGYFVWNLVVVNLLTQVLDNHPESKVETVQYLRIVDNIRRIFLKDSNMVFHLPQKLPMVCEPKDYVYSLDDPKVNKLGGYLLNDVHYTTSLIKVRIGHEKQTELRPKNMVVSMINGLSKTPYKINMETLNYIYAYGIEKNIIIDSNDSDLQSFKLNPYKSENKKYKEKYRSLISKVYMERNILSIAEIYSKVDKIYFPLRLDFRTRIYCQTDHFDYQKSDLAKGLILFANPGIINKYDEDVIKYFKAYGANMYGNALDKKSLNYRVKWIDDNTDLILNFENNDVVNKAENKVCFISFCFEYKRFIKFMDNNDSTVFQTYLPIQLDATCNGYQHLALLTKETKLLAKLNLDTSTHDDDPNDYYSYVASINKKFIKSGLSILPRKIADNLKSLQKMYSELNKDNLIGEYEKILNKVDDTINKKSGENIDIFIREINREIKKIEPKQLNNLLSKVVKQISEYKSLVKLDNLDLGRSILKKVLMQQSYSAGLPRLVNNILTDESVIELDKSMNTDKTDTRTYYKHINSKVIFTRYDIAIYVKSLIDLIRILAPKIDALSKYLNNIVNICTRLKMPIPWLLPSGAEIAESYLMEEERKIAAFTFTKSKYTFKTYIPGKYDMNKQRKAIRPNLIHSLDASTIAILYGYLGKDLYTVHDCFAVTADNIPLLMYKLKMVYIRLYSTNTYLLDFDNTLRLNINKIYSDKVLKLDGKCINMPDTKKPEIFPDVKDIVYLYTYNDEIKKLTESSYLVI